MSLKPPMPADELDRIMVLSEFDLDYSNLRDQFNDLTKLAARVAGTEISLINLVDAFTQWSVARYGMEIEQMPREESVCQYTIVNDSPFEVPDLAADERFKDKNYVAGDPNLRYYYGIPLSANGHRIGALCVLDKSQQSIQPEKEELLRIIADEVVTRLRTLTTIENLQKKVKEVSDTKRQLAHDIRGPLGGIIGLAHVISQQGDENDMEEVMEFINLIYKSGKSILELADEILSTDKDLLYPREKLNSNQYNLVMLKEKLIKLYQPQAINKQITFEVTTVPDNEAVPFSKQKLLQVIGNLVSNAIKFTAEGGKVTVNLSLKIGSPSNILEIIVTDTGTGMDTEKINSILNGKGESTHGTDGEQGYGFGLALVKHLVESMHGTMRIFSEPGKGTSFNLQLPQGLPH